MALKFLKYLIKRKKKPKEEPEMVVIEGPVHRVESPYKEPDYETTIVGSATSEPIPVKRERWLRVQCTKCGDVFQLGEDKYTGKKRIMPVCPSCNKRFMFNIPEEDQITN